MQAGSNSAAAFNAGVNSIATQGVMVAAGLQEKFSWKSVAAAAVSAAVSNQISTSIQGAPIRDGAGRLETGADGQILRANTAFANYNAGAARVTSDFISGITGAYIRHGITNSPINFKDAAAESLGNTLANEIVGGLIREEQTSKRLAEQVSLTNGPAREPSFRLNRQSALAFSDATDDLIVNESRRLVAFNNAVSDPLATQVTDGDEIVRAGDGSDPSLAVRVADTSSGRRIQSELNRQKPTGPTISVSRGPSFLDSLSIIWSGTNPRLANIGDSMSALYHSVDSYFLEDLIKDSNENLSRVSANFEGDNGYGATRTRGLLTLGRTLTGLIPTNGFDIAATAAPLGSVFRGLRIADEAGIVANKIPLGFRQASEFESFGGSLYNGLDAASYKNVQAAFQGSSVTGKAHRPPHAPFDVGHVSDFDIAISSPALFQSAKEFGIGLRQQGIRTRPLRPEHLERLGLSDLNVQLSQQAGRTVNFMIYRNIDDAVARSPSILVPRKPQ